MDINTLIKILPPWLRRHKLIRLMTWLKPRQPLYFNGNAKAYTSYADAAARQALITGVFEPEFLAIAKPFLFDGGVFFDVGANLGLCTFSLIGEFSPETNISYHLFEANPRLCQLLNDSYHRFHDIQDMYINLGCISNQPGVSQLNVTPNESGRSYISCGAQDAHQSRYPIIEVENIVLDQYFEDHSIQRVQFLKMDIEGWEPYALEGAKQTLSKGIVEAIYIEVSTENLTRAGFCVDDCLTKLIDAGFTLYWCKPQDILKDTIHLNIRGHKLAVAKFKAFPIEYQTDLLAIHQDADIHLVETQP